MIITTAIAIIAMLLSILVAVAAWACAAVGGEYDDEMGEYPHVLRRD